MLKDSLPRRTWQHISRRSEKGCRDLGKGPKNFAVHVKDVEPPEYDPRGLKGVALAPRNVMHRSIPPTSHDIQTKPSRAKNSAKKEK